MKSDGGLAVYRVRLIVRDNCMFIAMSCTKHTARQNAVSNSAGQERDWERRF